MSNITRSAAMPTIQALEKEGVGFQKKANPDLLSSVSKSLTRFGFYVLILSFGLLIFNAHSAAKMQDVPGSISVWNAWQGEDANILNDIALNYQKETGITIDLKTFGSEADLLTEVQTAAAAGNAPDVFLGSHVLGQELSLSGLVKGYCLPDSDVCSPCFGSNPPRWCQYAQGDFSVGRINDFLSDAQVKNVPDWLQLSMSDFIDGDYFPRGTLPWWDFLGIYINRKQFDQAGLQIPTNLAELNEVVAKYPQVYFEPGSLSLPQDPVPTLSADLKSVNPEDALVLIANSSQFTQLEKQVSDLTPLALSDYQPPIWVEGGFVLSTSKYPAAGLDFLYQLSEEDNQQRFFDSSGHLPANGEVLQGVAKSSESLDALIRMGKTGRPVAAPAPVSGASCLDFSGYPNGTLLSTIPVGGFTVTPFGAPAAYFINQSGSAIGLQFGDSGLNITAPPAAVPYQKIDVDAGAYSSDFVIKAADASGIGVGSLTIPQNNAVTSQSFAAPNAAYVDIVGGNNEGLLVKICFLP